MCPRLAPDLLYSRSWLNSLIFFLYLPRARITGTCLESTLYQRPITRAQEAGILILLLKIYLLSMMHHTRGEETVRVVMALQTSTVMTAYAQS